VGQKNEAAPSFLTDFKVFEYWIKEFLEKRILEENNSWRKSKPKLAKFYVHIRSHIQTFITVVIFFGLSS
jgi:hypothetical protein